MTAPDLPLLICLPSLKLKAESFKYVFRIQNPGSKVQDLYWHTVFEILDFGHWTLDGVLTDSRQHIPRQSIYKPSTAHEGGKNYF